MTIARWLTIFRSSTVPEKKQEAVEPKKPDCAECGRECFKPTPIGDSFLCGPCSTPWGFHVCVMCDGKGFNQESTGLKLCLACAGDGTISKRYAKKLRRWLEENKKEAAKDAASAAMSEKPADCTDIVPAGYYPCID